MTDGNVERQRKAGAPPAGVHAVIGASGGIGNAVSRRLAGGSAALWLGGRREEPLSQLAEELSARSMVVDATDFGAVEAFLDAALDEHETLRGVVCLAGSILLKPAHLTTSEELEQTLAANVRTAFATVRAAAPRMRKQGGAIVLVTSAAASIGLPNHEAIAAAKGAVAGLVRSAAATYARQGIRVNAVAPGLVRTPATERIFANENSVKASTAMHPSGRLGEPEDVARAVTWLLEGASDWVTGQIIAVDGGLSGLKGRS
jgi:NAD(P)-dependent dehydrogenase (short-subunit alcohol dehydrogenase family)